MWPVKWTTLYLTSLQRVRGEENVSSEVDLSELGSFLLSDDVMHGNVAIGVAYVSKSFVWLIPTGC